ncbi:MAG: NAD(P)-dependent oxidoreductase [Actinomycetota bacterium]
MTQTIGVLGLGRMGSHIAERLAAAGHPVIGFDPDAAATAPGVGRAESVEALCAASTVLLSVLPGRAELAESEAGIVAALAPGSLWIDLTSGDPELAVLIATRCDAAGVSVVFAPMGGGPAAAASGDLVFYTGGPSVDRARPMLELLGAVEHCGPGAGDGLTVKLVANLLWFGQLAAVAEATSLAESLGLAAETLERVLPRTAAASALLDGYLPLVLRGEPEPSFGIDRMVEELATLERLAGDRPFELSRLVARLHRDALERFGSIDDELLVARLLRERDGGFGHRQG